MTSDEFMDLALRVTEGTVTPDERARFEEELIRQPQRRDEWLALRRELEAVRESAAAADALSGPAGSIPAGRLAGLMGQAQTPARPRRRYFWPAAGLAAAAAVALTLWLGSPPARSPVTPAGDAVPLAFVIPQGGEIAVATAQGVRSSGLPQPLTGGETVTVAAGRGALLLTPDGRITTIRGTYRTQPVARETGAPGLRWFTTPLAQLAAGPGLTRGGEDLRVLSPRGATASTEPTVAWVAVPGRTYEVELRDALQPAAQPARAQGVVPPLAFSRLQPAPLAAGGIYILGIHESGHPATGVSERFMVVPSGQPLGGEDNAALVAAAFQALAASPARTGDAWLLLQKLPPGWRESELGRRLSAGVGGQ